MLKASQFGVPLRHNLSWAAAHAFQSLEQMGSGVAGPWCDPMLHTAPLHFHPVSALLAAPDLRRRWLHAVHMHAGDWLQGLASHRQLLRRHKVHNMTPRLLTGPP